jgi:hypothetical protein
MRQEQWAGLECPHLEEEAYVQALCEVMYDTSQHKQGIFARPSSRHASRSKLAESELSVEINTVTGLHDQHMCSR